MYRPKVLEEVAKTIQCEEAASRDFMEAESDYTEKDGENSETSNLNWLTPNRIDGCNGDPVTRDETGDRQNEIANTVIVESWDISPSKQRNEVLLVDS
jgi:hypothetical protein